MDQRFTFDRIADIYRAARLDYPEALIEEVISFADLKPDDKIEKLDAARVKRQRVSLGGASRYLRLILDRHASLPRES